MGTKQNEAREAAGQNIEHSKADQERKKAAAISNGEGGRRKVGKVGGPVLEKTKEHLGIAKEKWSSPTIMLL